MTALRQSYLCKSMGTCSWWGCQRSIKVLASIPRSCSHPIDYILASKGSTSLDFESTALLYRDLQDPSLERESWTSSIHYQLEKTIIPQNQKKKKRGAKFHSQRPSTLSSLLLVWISPEQTAYCPHHSQNFRIELTPITLQPLHPIMPACGCPDVTLANGQIRSCTCQPCSSGNLDGCSCNKETGCGCTSSVLPLDSADRCLCAASGKSCNCAGCLCKTNVTPGSCCTSQPQAWSRKTADRITTGWIFFFWFRLRDLSGRIWAWYFLGVLCFAVGDQRIWNDNQEPLP